VEEDLRKSIREKERQMVQLAAHSNKSSICSDLYNKIVLEKAILKKELQDLDKNMFVENIKRLMPRKKVYICDYFRET
jgi:hypothetical protein